VVLYLKRLYEDRCCLCGKSVLLDESRRYSEAGHVWPVGKPFEGPDHPSNVLIFCPNHHKAFDYGAAYLVAAGGDYAIRSAVGDNEIDGGVFTPKPEHGLNPEFVSKHAGHFLRD
jgi:predicted restriction endonuclease